MHKKHATTLNELWACNMFNLKILIKDSLTTFINFLLNNLP